MSKVFSMSGALLLLFMAAYHGSGVVEISADLAGSNAPDYLKNIFPILFLNTSLYLATLAVFALFAAISAASRSLNALIAVSAFANAGLGAYLNEWLPAGVLAFIGVLFIAASLTARPSE